MNDGKHRAVRDQVGKELWGRFVRSAPVDLIASSAGHVGAIVAK
jgi:hypothetical protein